MTFFVADIPAARTWLASLLGSAPHLDHPGLVTFQVGEQSIGLHPADEKSPAGPGGQVAYWRVPDLDLAMLHFQAHGCTLWRGPVTGIEGSRVCQVRDPFGNAWGLIQER